VIPLLVATVLAAGWTILVVTLPSASFRFRVREYSAEHPKAFDTVFGFSARSTNKHYRVLPLDNTAVCHVIRVWERFPIRSLGVSGASTGYLDNGRGFTLGKLSGIGVMGRVTGGIDRKFA
jgi:hypothetical protein